MYGETKKLAARDWHKPIIANEKFNVKAVYIFFLLQVEVKLS